MENWIFFFMLTTIRTGFYQPSNFALTLFFIFSIF